VRLSSIKLSGFKSFAEPTNFLLPGQLVGVVGPNGCGKSNIMDAVRWVLGESKASELRGESMQDVIFNGTTTRKPASRSSVELVFDNDDHRAGGQWNQFSEIAVKRVLTRDGTSSYYLNGQPVRRRDVQDVFLGTGLGPRAYAIIGQGTISRIIESRPEELRLFLEEAAGVSKYKERRRETENRLEDTRENLTRVQDIQRELSFNLEKLEQQAAVAEKFHALSAQATLKQHQLWYLKRAEALAELVRIEAGAANATTALDAGLADLRHVESELEVVRQAHYTSGDQVNQAQGNLYEVSAEVGRLEAEIRFVIERRQRAEQRLQVLHDQATQWGVREHDAQTELQNLAHQEEHSSEHTELLEAQVQEQSRLLPELEDALRRAQRDASDQRTSVSQVQQQMSLLAAQQRHFDEQTHQLDARRARLLQDERNLVAPDSLLLEEHKRQLEQWLEANKTLELQVQQWQLEVPALDTERRAQQQRVNAEAATLADLSARLQALKALQDRLQTNDKLLPWLQRQELDQLHGLWQRLQVELGWENALEAALRERMGALEVSKLEMARGFTNDVPPAKLVFFGVPNAGEPAATTRLPRMSDLLHIPDAGLKAVLDDWLQGSFTADTLDNALAQRHELLAGQLIYVKDGHAVGRHSVHFYAADSEQSGLLARSQEIDNLAKQLRAQTLICDDARAQLIRAEAAFATLSQRLAAARDEASKSQTKSHALQVELLRMTQAAEQVQLKSGQIAAVLHDVDIQLQNLQSRQDQGQEQFEVLDAQLAQTQERQVELDDLVMAAERALADYRDQQRSLERQAQEAGFVLRHLQTRRAELLRTLESTAQQLQSINAETVLVQDELAQLNDAAAQAGLQQALAQKLEREHQLAVQRSQYDDLTLKLRASDERRLQLERALEPLRARITEFQLKEQAARLGSEQLARLLADASADLDTVARSVTEGAVQLAGLQPDIDRLTRDITALGAVNLAALDELVAARERKGFLDVQSADLAEAMATLEDAIKKIDAETRELLSGTFNTVNEHFGRMFPDLFGGGTARLVITGDEILDSGVQVFAQPPGKKNQSIALLSGGEKALTAIALVFAIFQLNPAPFCLLDEVDAPLDDANTERYAKLVARMSHDTQFLFISHNKIAMEMAQQLIGVTMQEQGVSRIVAVDMNAALTLADQE